MLYKQVYEIYCNLIKIFNKGIDLGIWSEMLVYLVVFMVAAVWGFRAPMSDIVSAPPGFMGFSSTIYAGYLKSSNTTFAHYIFVESAKGSSNRDPITLWINGQPGCSSKIGFLKQIGPYLVTDGVPYQFGDALTMNPYSWHKLSNLLFIDCPSGVGYNQPPPQSYNYTDSTTSQQHLSSLQDFFSKFPQYLQNDFFIAGEYYAGKMIPDLALKITDYNQKSQSKINIKGILVGNGVMDFSGNGLERSQIDYMYSRNFVDPTLDKYWEIACQADVTSAGCTFFLRRYDALLANVNLHNIYGKCYQLNPQPQPSSQQNPQKIPYNNNFTKCQYQSSLFSYFNFHKIAYHSMTPQIFTPCNETIFTKYTTTETGSMEQYSRLIRENLVRVHLYAGDWDDVVPYVDTVRNLGRIGLKEEDGGVGYWVEDGQHVGFKRRFVKDGVGVKLWIVKGAGHQVPQHKPKIAYQLFKSFLNNTD